MGSCFSKCTPKKRKFKEEFNHVQDKLVISQAPPAVSPLSLPTHKTLPPPPSPPTSSTSSGCSLSSSLSLSSSCSSSVLSSRDRSFSSEFLWSCVKENPHIIGLDTIKGSLEQPVKNRIHARKFDLPAKTIVAPPSQKQPVAEMVLHSTPQKRPRSNSPTLTRQKSFRREPERPSSTYLHPNRTTRSPSPSRRFNGDNCRGVSKNTQQEISYYKQSVGSMENAVNSSGLFGRKENLRPASPNNNLGRYHSSLKNKVAYAHQVAKVDEISVPAAVSSQNVDPIPMEDIDNPLIALDCFIFL
ncbi:unnamed protein product [Ilex paraguariensis]|uniref:Uncharacterized protein n=1 Tax=Ilex paraguariensis TaxID=185542 RepID=A0ABC8R6Q2_9AQUA